MTQAQDLLEPSILTRIRELERAYDDCKEPTLEFIDYLINQLKEIGVLDVDWAHDLYFYCKENENQYKNLLDFVKVLNDRIKDNGDNQVSIEGQTGSGKSTLAMCVMCLLAYRQGKKFSLSKEVVYLPKEKELSDRLSELKKMENLWVDEAIKSLNKLKFYDKDQIESSETIQTERFRLNTILYLLPRFYDLNSSFRNNIIKVRVWIISRQCACVRVKDIHPDMGAADPWHLDENLKTLKRYNIGVKSTTDELLVAERHLKNYLTDFTWPHLAGLDQFRSLELLYNLYKKQSRLMAKIKEKEPEEEKLSKAEAKRLSWVKMLMRKSIVKDKMTFTNWFEEYKPFLGEENRTTFYRHWESVAGKEEAKA
jgi:ABC-type oligopeptide transport system ATPase subunit